MVRLECPVTGDDVSGRVIYSESTGAIEVEFPDPRVRDEIMDYLESPRTFQIPEGRELDDFREETAKPSDSLCHFQLAMCQLWSETGVMVRWEEATQTEEES